jgi:hypothetical protein
VGCPEAPRPGCRSACNRRLGSPPHSLADWANPAATHREHAWSLPGGASKQSKTAHCPSGGGCFDHRHHRLRVPSRVAKSRRGEGLVAARTHNEPLLGLNLSRSWR